MKENSCYSFFSILSSTTRLKIVEALYKKPMSVTELCKTTKEEQSNVSHALKVLEYCKFVDVKKEGKQRIYSLNKETATPLMKLAEKHMKKFCCNHCNGCKK